MKFFLSCALLLLLIACNKNNCELHDVIFYNPDDKANISVPQNIFSSIQIISLKCPDEIIVDPEGDVIYKENKFYCVDFKRNRVDIFDSNGLYICSVASQGRSGNEYLGIAGVQVIDDCVAIYSYHNKAVYYYDIDGTFVRKDPIECNPMNLLKNGNYYWGYTGFSNGKISERVVKMNSDGQIIEKYMPSNAAIIPMEERGDVFIIHDGDVLIRESFCNKISCINKMGQVETFLKFDFGKYNVPDKYFKYSDPYTAAQKLLNSDFAIMERFFINQNHLVLSVNFQFGSQEGKIISSLGVESNGKWRWLKSEKEGTLSMFFSSTRQMTSDSDVVLLVDGERVREFAAGYPELVGEFDDTTDNPCIVLCRLK